MSIPQGMSSMFELEFPQSVGVYDSYTDAQKAVDFLADAKFEVQNLAIVGTELRSVERVLGRKSWGTVILSGVQTGLTTGLLVGVLLFLFVPVPNPILLFAGALAIGIVINIIFQAIAYALSQGKRDFTSITQTVATKYEVLCEHKVAAKARELLLQSPGARAAAFD